MVYPFHINTVCRSRPRPIRRTSFVYALTHPLPNIPVGPLACRALALRVFSAADGSARRRRARDSGDQRGGEENENEVSSGRSRGKRANYCWLHAGQECSLMVGVSTIGDEK